MFIEDLYGLLGSLLEDEAALLGALDECKFVRARCLVHNLARLWVFINNNSVAYRQ